MRMSGADHQRTGFDAAFLCDKFLRGLYYVCRDSIITTGDPAAECADGTIGAPTACTGGVYTEGQDCGAVAAAEGWTYTGYCRLDEGINYYMFGDCDCNSLFTNCWGCYMSGGNFTCLAP